MTISESIETLNYLKKIKIDKHLHYLSQKYKDKKVVFYGGGEFFQVLAKNYDLSGLDIVGVADQAFEKYELEDLSGYKKLKPSNLQEINPDVVILSVLYQEKLLKILKKQYKDINFCTSIPVIYIKRQKITEFIKDFFVRPLTRCC